MFSIGEFSKVTGLTVKTLRFYHEQELLVPTHVDPQSGYRYYAEKKVETARVIHALRLLDFPLTEIAEILENFQDDADILDYLERRQDAIELKLREHRRIAGSLKQIIQHEKEARETMEQNSFEIQEKTVEPQLFAGVRMQGKYSDCCQGFSKIGRAAGRHICGKSFLLCYDIEFKENDADFEACLPIRKEITKEGISVRTLEGGRCLSLLHKGPYEELKRSYEKMFEYIKTHNLKPKEPTREVYLKGPGMIFKGNPKKYLTEIQVFLEE